MRIKQLSIPTYPPLEGVKHKLKPGFNLLFGPNERGKSLTIDAIVKLLLGRDSKGFYQIDRVPEQPGKFQGFVELEYTDQEGELRSKKFQGQEKLPDFLNLSADDCQNLFFIRNSQLSIGREPDSERTFYTNYTDRLTGLKTQQISALKKELLSQANITPSNHQFTDRETGEADHKLATRVEDAKKLLSDQGLITRLLTDQELIVSGQALQKAAVLKSELKIAKQLQTKLEKAKKREDYQEINALLKEINNLEKRLSDLSQFKQTDFEKWQELRTRIEELENQKQQKKQDLNDKKDYYAKLNKQLKTVEKELAKHQARNEKIKSQIAPKLDQLKQQKAALKAGEEEKQKLWISIALSSLLVLIASLIATTFSRGAFPLITGIISLIISIYFLYQLITLRSQKSASKQQINHLKMDLNQLEFEVDSFAEMTRAVQKFFDELKQLEKDQLLTERDVKKTKEEIDLLQKKSLRELRKEIKEHKGRIKQIKQKTQVKDFAQYQQKFKIKQDLVSDLEKKQAVLANKVAGQETNLEKTIELAKKKASQLAVAADQAQSINYNQEKHQQLKSKQDALEAEIKDLEQSAGYFQQTMQELQAKVQEILLTIEEPIQLQSQADVNYAKNKLQQFVAHLQKQRQFALQTIEVLEQIEQEDKQKIASLFGKESAISQHFSHITNHRYPLVEFDQKTELIVVTNQQNQAQTPDQLSAGTRDQLYFAIRVGLGRKLLSQPGFFVLDDPFIKADQQRLEKQLMMLDRLSQAGWQILYFSAKNEVKQALEKLDSHHLIEV